MEFLIVFVLERSFLFDAFRRLVFVEQKHLVGPFKLDGSGFDVAGSLDLLPVGQIFLMKELSFLSLGHKDILSNIRVFKLEFLSLLHAKELYFLERNIDELDYFCLIIMLEGFRLLFHFVDGSLNSLLPPDLLFRFLSSPWVFLPSGGLALLLIIIMLLRMDFYFFPVIFLLIEYTLTLLFQLDIHLSAGQIISVFKLLIFFVFLLPFYPS